VFTGLQPTSSGFRRHAVVAGSVTAHLIALAIIVFHAPKVIEVSPAWLAHGDSDHTYRLTYLPPANGNDAPPRCGPAAVSAACQQAAPAATSEVPAREAFTGTSTAVADADPGDHISRAGSPLGTMIDGPITGHEVHVAYPTIYPDPPVDRSELPRDLVGDVVIEVTIDSAGNVVDTKIVQAIGHGIDEKIESTLRRWHYQPATLDGTPVASRHDVHFHFPS
jgi:TonB family protein